MNISGGAIAFGDLAVEGGTVTVVALAISTAQTITLTGFDADGWDGAVLLNPGIIEGGALAYLRFVDSVGSSPRVRIASSATAEPTDAGPEFTEAVETGDDAFLFDADGDTVTLKGPNHPDNGFSDPTEPYFWTPDNTAAWNTWYSAAASAALVTVTISGVPPPPPPPLNISGGAITFGALAVSGGTVVVALPLLLAAWVTPDGQGDVFAALVEAGGDRDNIYRHPDNGTAEGDLLDGDLDVAASQPITRIRVRDDAGTDELVLNDNPSAADLGALFGTDGALFGATIYLQTADETQSFAVDGNTDVMGGNFAQFRPPAAFITLADTLTAGDRFIFAMTVPSEVPALNITGGSIDFGALAVAGGTVTVSFPTPLNVSGGAVTFGEMSLTGGAVVIAPPHR